MDGLPDSHDVSGDPSFKRIRAGHFRHLKASLSLSAIMAGAVHYASHSFGGRGFDGTSLLSASTVSSATAFSAPTELQESAIEEVELVKGKDALTKVQ